MITCAAGAVAGEPATSGARQVAGRAGAAAAPAAAQAAAPAASETSSRDASGASTLETIWPRRGTVIALTAAAVAAGPAAAAPAHAFHRRRLDADGGGPAALLPRRAARCRPRGSACSGCPTGASTARRITARSSSTPRSSPLSSACSRASTRHGSRSGGCSPSTPSAAATTARWPPTTPPPSTAATAVAPGPKPLVRARVRRGDRRRPGRESVSRRRPRLPPAGRRYLDRSLVRPGMAVPGGKLVSAFAAVGWQWGGRWTGSPDYAAFLGDRRLRARREQVLPPAD